MNPPLQNRLIPLSDGRPGLRSLLQCDVTNPPDQSPAPCLDFVSSDATLDRYNEIISPEGWDLSTYQKNPVFQNSHQYGDIIHTLGKALITEVRSGSPLPSDGRGAGGEGSYLFQRIQFAVEANPIARIAYPLYHHGYLRAVSVGLIPIRWEDGTPDTPYRRKYTQQELLEVSAVAIPANPAALALALKSGALLKSDLQETANLIRQALADTTNPPPEHPLIQLTRQIREQLKHL